MSPQVKALNEMVLNNQIMLLRNIATVEEDAGKAAQATSDCHGGHDPKGTAAEVLRRKHRAEAYRDLADVLEKKLLPQEEGGPT